MKFPAKSFLLLPGLFALLFCSIFSCENSPAENNNPQTQQPEPNQQVKAEWLSEIPAEVPAFTFGQLADSKTNHTNENLTWVLKYSGTDASNVHAYNEILKKEGFNPSTMSLGENGNMIVGQKNKLTVTLNYKNGLTTVGDRKSVV